MLALMKQKLSSLNNEELILYKPSLLDTKELVAFTQQVYHLLKRFIPNVGEDWEQDVSAAIVKHVRKADESLLERDHRFI